MAGALAMGGFAAVSAISPATSQAAPVSPVAPAASGCQLGNGVKHVVEITFDNVHFNRDNPNVPSDLEMIPSLENFIEGNGTLLSNNHTPLIAHTAVDSLTTYTGLYGDRAGMPISNSYQAYNTDGPNNTYNTPDLAGSFASSMASGLFGPKTFGMSSALFSRTMFAVETSPTLQPARVKGTHGAGVSVVGATGATEVAGGTGE